MYDLKRIAERKGIAYKVVSDALGIHPNNMPRYDDLMKRSVEEVMIISKATNIDISELIGISLPRQSEVPTPITNERLFSVIESQQRTIENLSKK